MNLIDMIIATSLLHTVHSIPLQNLHVQMTPAKMALVSKQLTQLVITADAILSMWALIAISVSMIQKLISHRSVNGKECVKLFLYLLEFLSSH